MARYRKVDVRMWTDERFLKLTAAKPNAQTLWLYLLTTPHQTAIPGLLPLGAGTIGDDLDWSRNDVKKFLVELEDAGMIVTGESNGLIETVEIEGHPWFLGVQFHPEFTSRLQTPNPSILAFVKASLSAE